MSIQEYLNKRIGVISLNSISLIVLSVFLFSSGNTFEVIKIIWITWGMVLSMYLLHEYKTIEKHFYKLNKYIENTDKKYLLSEIIEQPKYIEAIPYYYILKKASKSMREEINTIKN